MASLTSNGSRSSANDYFYFSTTDENIQKLITYNGPEDATAHPEWWPTRADPRDELVIRSYDGKLPAISPLGHDDVKQIISNSGIYIVDVTNNAYHTATGSWVSYTGNSQYKGKLAYDPFLLASTQGVGNYYFNTKHKSWRIERSPPSGGIGGSATINVWASYGGPSGWYGVFHNEDDALASPKARDGGIVYIESDSDLEVLSGYTAPTQDVGTVRQWVLVGQQDITSRSKTEIFEHTSNLPELSNYGWVSIDVADEHSLYKKRGDVIIKAELWDGSTKIYSLSHMRFSLDDFAELPVTSSLTTSNSSSIRDALSLVTSGGQGSINNSGTIGVVFVVRTHSDGDFALRSPVWETFSDNGGSADRRYRFNIELITY